MIRPCAFCGTVLVTLVACSSPEIVRIDSELVDNAAAAGTAFELGQFEQAMEFYRRARNRARVMDDPVEIGNAAYNVAACAIALRDHEAALAALREAERELARAGVVTDEVLLLRAQAQYELGWLARARATIDGARTGGGALGVELAVLSGHVACAQDRVERAREELDAARALARGTSDAGIAGLSGRLLLREGRPRDAAVEFDLEAELSREAKNYDRMSQATVRAARALAEAGAWAEAADRWFRAARSDFAGGHLEEALARCAEAVDAAARTEDRELARRVADLLREIEAAAR